MLVLLDRDGVINEDLPRGVTSLSEFRFLPNALNAIAMLKRHRIKVAIITNQSAVAKGWMDETMLETIHRHMCHEIEAAGGRIDKIYICTDHPDHPTHRRKPSPGMLEEALADFSASAADTPFIGDAVRDMQAAYATGCPRILVKTGKGNLSLHNAGLDHVQPVAVYDDLFAAVTGIIATVTR